MIPSMSLESELGEAVHRKRLLDDPVVIRALAHPLRLDLLAALGRAGRATTADAARELGISHGLASHHLRQLAKYGFVEQVAGKDNRERPWRVVAASMQWPDAPSGTAAAAATEVLEQVIVERALEGFLRWQQQRGDWPEQWLAGSGIGTATVYLTAAELAGVTAEFEAMIRRYTDARPLDDVASRPAGSVPVDIAFLAVPTAKPTAGA